MKNENTEKIGDWTKVNVINIFKRIDVRGQIMPVVLIDPPMSIGKHSLKVIYIRSWDDIKELKIFIGGTLEYCRNGGSYELRPSETSTDAALKMNEIVPTVCPMCGCKELKASRTAMRCENPESDYYNIRAVWLFIKVCMGINNITYSKVYKLWELNLLKDIRDLWLLNDSALEELDLTKESITIFKDILKNLTEVELEKLIYCLSVPGIKAAYALEIARRIGNTVWYYPVNDDKLTEYLNSEKRQKADVEAVKRMDAVEPVLIWNEYVNRNRVYLAELNKCFKIIKPPARLNCAGVTINIGKTGPKFTKYLVSDLIKLKDGNIIDIINRSITYYVTMYRKQLLESDSKLARELLEIQTPILKVREFFNKFRIKYPDIELTFKSDDPSSLEDL